MKQVALIPLKNPVTKTIEIPGSKSYTNRALLMAALTANPVTIINPLFSDDTKAMITCLMRLGITVEIKSKEIIVKGSIDDVQNDTYELNTNLAATAIRFLLPLLCVIPGKKLITGNEGLNKRPIGELVEALRNLGAKIDYLDNEGYPPLCVTSSKLESKTISVKGNISSQFFSALFLLAPRIGGLTIKVEGKQISKPYIDMTIDSVKHFGIIVENNKYETYTIPAGQIYNCKTYYIEGDFSSAGYFFAIAALTKSTITLKNLNPDSLQADKKLLPVLEQMGNVITYDKDSITIVGKGVKPVSVDMIDFPDQAQTLAVLAAFAKGKTVLTGLTSLHVKETDRLKATVNELKKMKIKTESTNDTLTIYGGTPSAAVIDTYGDQRTAMSFAVAGAKISGLIINDPDVINKTFPDFWEKLEELGMGISKKNSYTSIYINGFRGTGKSTIGPLIAKKLNWDYVDMDETIAKKTQKNIYEITKNGTDWQEFRNIENELLKELLTKENIVVTTGGGTAVNDNQKNGTGKTFGEINAELLKKKYNALIILLLADEDVIADRIKKHELAIFDKPMLRPILNEKYAKRVQTIITQYPNDPEKQKNILIKHIINDGLQIYKKRKLIYKLLTNHYIDTGKLSLEESVNAILDLMKENHNE